MARRCAGCGAEAADEARFCAGCGAPLEPLEGAERKLATILFCDLVGSTELAAGRDPEELRRTLSPFFELARTTIEEHGGTLEKYVGDAVLAAFGVPRAHGDDPDRAIAAGLMLTERLPELGGELRVRVGVEAGEVLAQVGGERDLAVTGEPVNAAARLQQAAAPGEVVVGERAANAARSARLERRAPVEAKGFPAPLAAWRAIEVADRPLQAAAAPFVGREDDLSLLRLVYRRAVGQRSPQLVTVTGEAGIGKTRLANELLAELACEPEEPEVLLGRNPPYGRGIALWALGEIIHAAAGRGVEATVDEVREGLAARLEAAGASDAGELAAALAVPLGGNGDGRGPDVEDALRRGWRRMVALLAAERPLVIGIDDAHWADDGLLDLVEEIALGLDEARLLVLCTSRPELLERRPGFGGEAPNVTRIELRPLAPDAAAQLSACLLPDRAPELAARVAEASGGNPFFTEEMTRRIAEDPAALAEAMPETVQGAVAARLDMLPREEKRAIQHAAVLGQAFSARALAELCGGDVGEALTALVRKALVQERLAEGPGRYAFRHQLITDVAYGSLPRSERARLHERAADAIVVGTHPELAELDAFHRVRAHELDGSAERRRAAFEAVTEAAAMVVRRGASMRAQHLYEQGAELSDSIRERLRCLDLAALLALRRFRGDEALRLRREQAHAAEAAGECALAAAAYARAVEIPARMGGVTGNLPESEMRKMLERGRTLVADDDADTRARLLLGEAWIAWRFSRMDEMRRPALEGLAAARESGEPKLISGALDALSALQWHEGDFAASVASTRERLELLDSAGDSPEVEYEAGDARHMLIASLTQSGRVREASALAAQARDADLVRGVEHSAWERGLLPMFYLGEWDDALTEARRARDYWIEAGRPPISAWVPGLATTIAIHGHRGEERESLAWFDFILGLLADDDRQRDSALLMRGDALLFAGRTEEAAELLAAPSEIWSWSHVTYCAIRTEALVAAGRAGAELLAETEALAAQHPYARGVVSRARGMLDADDEALRAALDLFEQVGCPHQAARTRWLLGGDERAAARRAFEALGVPPPER